jgi:hypothetical protein
MLVTACIHPVVQAKTMERLNKDFPGIDFYRAGKEKGRIWKAMGAYERSVSGWSGCSPMGRTGVHDTGTGLGQLTGWCVGFSSARRWSEHTPSKFPTAQARPLPPRGPPGLFPLPPPHSRSTRRLPKQTARGIMLSCLPERPPAASIPVLARVPVQRVQ